MGVPKRRVSKRRARMRRAHWLKIDPPVLVPCPRCHALTLPHHVCPECGYYKAKKVMEVE